MSRKLFIPVEFGATQASIDKIKGILNAAVSAKVSMFTPEQMKEVDALKASISKISEQYSKEFASGKMTKPMMKLFKESYDEIITDTKRLASGLEKNLKLNKNDFLSDEQKQQVIAYRLEIETLNQKVAEFKKAAKDKTGKMNFKDVLNGTAGAEDLKGFGQITNLDTAYDKIERKLEELQKLRAGVVNSKGKALYGKASERDAIDEEIKLYDTLKNRIMGVKATQIEIENDAQKEIMDTNKLIQDKEDAIERLGDEAIQSGKEVAAGMKDQAKNIDASLGSLKWKEAIGLKDGKLDVFGGFMTGVTDKVKGFVTGITSGVLILQTMRRVVGDTIKTIRDLDKAFNDIAMVTTYTTEEVWQMKDAFVSIADTAGLSVVEITKVAGEFFRQGRSLSETLKLTEAAGIAAKVAGIEATESVDYLTSAINGYKLSADQAMAVSDKFAALAAGSATDYEELAIALSKVAAQAYSAGINMDNMMGFIAKALETTREAPENIGTAFKTIFARMSELKDYGKTLEDGMDINRIDTALKTIGVNLTNQENELRDLDEVLIDVGGRWASLTKNQKAYVTTALAGSRQQTRLLAIFEDFDRTMELTEMSANSLGATFAQQEKYYSSIAYAQNQLTVAWQNFVSNLGSSALFVVFYDVFAGLVNVFNNFNSAFKTAGPLVTAFIFSLLGLTAAMALSNKAVLRKITIAGIANGLDQVAIDKQIALAIANGTASASFQTLGASILKANAAMWAFILNPATGWMVALAVAVVGVGVALGMLANKNKNFVESMRKSQAEIFNFRKEAEDLSKLLDEYKEIDLKINLNDSDITRQEELIRQIQDLVGEDVNIFNVEGEIDLSKVEAEIEGLKNKGEKAFKSMLNTTIATYGSIAQAYKETNDKTTKDALVLQQVLAANTDLDYDKFLNLEKSKREELKKTATLVLELNKKATNSAIEYYNMDKGLVDKNIETDIAYYEALGNDHGTAYNKALQNAAAKGQISLSTELVLDKGEEEKATEALQNLLGADFSEQSILKQLELLSEFKFADWGSDVTSTIGKIVPEVQGITSLLEKLGNVSVETAMQMVGASGRTTEQIYALNDAISGLDITPEQQSALFTELLASGSDAFTGIQKFIDDYNIGFFKAVEITQQLKDAISDVSFESLKDSIDSIRSVDGDLEKINNMITGEESYDLSFMREMIELYPQVGDAIRNNKELSSEAIKEIMEAEKDALKQDIDNQITSLEADIINNEAKIEAYGQMLLVEDELNKLRGDKSVALENLTLTELETLYETYLANKERAASTSAYNIAKNDLEIGKSSMEAGEYEIAMGGLESAYKEAAATINKAFSTGAGTEVAAETFSTRIGAAIDQLKANNQTLRNQIANLEFLKNNIDEVTKSTNASTKSAEEYKAALDEIYILTQQLTFLQNELSKYEFMEDHAKTSEEYLTAIYAQNAALEAQIDTTNALISAQERSQNSIFSSLGNLQGSVQLINGRMVPVMQNYINLSSEQQEIVDNAVESYNDLSDSINDNSMSVEENTALMEENLQKLEDKTVEFYDILADAIKNAEKKKLDALKEGLEAERKILDQRRKMYEKAFSEEDYNASLEETNAERESIIEQLSSLEGATDLSSLQKRQELLQRKAELDKSYNDEVRDYNREALLDAFDEEEELIDQREADYEAAYEERINSVEWLESEIQRIMNEGQAATIDYLKEHSQEYEDAWTITRDNIAGKWNMLYGIVNGSVEDIINNIPDFTNMLEQLRLAAEYVGRINSGGKGGGGGSGGDGDTGGDTGGGKSDAEILREGWNKEVDKLNAFADQEFWDEWAGQHATMVDMINRSSGALSKGIAAGGPDPKKWKFKKYKKGGIADFTGPAWLDGTKKEPERILSGVQTELFDRMVQNLESINSSPKTSNSNASINIENISITTGQLNSSQDFKSAGRALAEEIKIAISERGLPINIKK